MKESLKIDVVENHDPRIAREYGLEAPFRSCSYTFVLRPEVG